MNITKNELPHPLPRGARTGAKSLQHGYETAADPKQDQAGFVSLSRRLFFFTCLALLACCLPAVQSLKAMPASLPMQPGEIAITHSTLGASPNFTVEIIDTRPPFGPLGANWLAPMFYNEFPVTANTWNAANLGQVFGICLDNTVPPNIYVTATTAYNNSPPAIPGRVYKLNGTTGAISPFTTITSGPASLGNICFDAVNNQFFVSDLDTGLIYRVNNAGVQQPPAYDHGTNGRPNESLAKIFDSITPGLTAAGRRVWGLQVYNNRLYYSVWTVDQNNPSNNTSNEIWSVGINNPGGTFNLGSIIGGGPRREIMLPAYNTGSNWSPPVSSIAFSKSGRMLLAERSSYANGTSYYTGAHNSRVLEYILSGGIWTSSGDNYLVGAYSANHNAAGGADYDCQEDAIVTGDALMLPYAPPTNTSVILYGVQIIPAGGNTPATSISTSYLIDSDGDTTNYDKTFQGAVVDYRVNCGCLIITNQSIDCIATNNTYVWNFCVTNNFNGPIGYLSFPDLPAGVTISQDIYQISPFLQQGQGTCVTLYITNTTGATNVCFTMGAHSTNLVECCSISNCLTFAACCAHVSSETNSPVKGSPNCYNYFFTVENVTQQPVSYLFLIPDPYSSCLAFTPDIIHLNTPLLPGQTSGLLGPVKVCVDPTCHKPLYFLLSLQNSNLVECCASRHLLPFPAALPISIANPLDGSVFVQGTPIPLVAGMSGDITFTSVSYLANGGVIASSSVPPFSASWTNAPVGQYELTADGSETNGGGIWISDPVGITVTAASPPSIGAGTFWKYLDDGSDQGTAWRTAGFNDSLWAYAQAPLGYGNGTEATVVNGGPPTNRIVTTYFRDSFYVAAPAAVSNLTVHLRAEDGAIVYLNGTEVFRSNMPTGIVNYATLAASAAGTNSTQFLSASISPSLLTATVNYLDVEVHVASHTNSAMAFDLALDTSAAGGGNSGPVLNALGCVGNKLNFCVPTVAGATYYVETSTSLSSPVWKVVQTISGTGSMVTVTNTIGTAPQMFYRVRVGQ